MKKNKDFIVVSWNEPEDAKVQFVTVPDKLDSEVYMEEFIDALPEKWKEYFKPKPIWAFAIYTGSSGDQWIEPSHLSDENEAKSFILNNARIGFIVKANKEVIPVKALEWEKRDQASSAKEAMEYIAEHLASVLPLKTSNLDEVKEFADKWNIPFSVELINMIDFKSSIRHFQRWNSSYC